MANRTTEYKNIISMHNTDEFFSERANNLKRIYSYHMFRIQMAAIGKFPMITYREKDVFSLQDLITNSTELLPSELKSIIWQVTKLMISCETEKINHLRLCPKAIVFKETYSNSNPIFLMVKDFSLGKEYQTVKEGKVQQIFEYLHPDLSISNKMIDFDLCAPEYDIWSLGIILYKLIYYKSPFCKPGKSIFSKTILREYLQGQFEVSYPKNKFDSINKFISRCLPNPATTQKFKQWSNIKRFILDQEQIYHELDFHDGNFSEMAEIHLKLMVFLSSIYCMIIDECSESPNSFWRIPVSKEISIPFQITICEFTLTLMKSLEQRFYRIYSGHLFQLRKETLNQLEFISNSLKNEMKHINYKKCIDWRLCTDTLNIDILNIIQDICVRLKLEASQENERIEMARKPSEKFDSNRIKEKRSLLMRKKDSKNSGNSNGKGSRKVWKSVQILFDYCSEVLNVVASSKQRMKYIYEEFYINSIFDSILIEEFDYKRDLSGIFKKVYKDYIV